MPISGPQAARMSDMELLEHFAPMIETQVGMYLGSCPELQDDARQLARLRLLRVRARATQRDARMAHVENFSGLAFIALRNGLLGLLKRHQTRARRYVTLDDAGDDDLRWESPPNHEARWRLLWHDIAAHLTPADLPVLDAVVAYACVAKQPLALRAFSRMVQAPERSVARSLDRVRRAVRRALADDPVAA